MRLPPTRLRNANGAKLRKKKNRAARRTAVSEEMPSSSKSEAAVQARSVTEM
jgi:hypothetical protein